MEMVGAKTLQAQGWKKWLSRIRFSGRDKLYTIRSEIYPDLPLLQLLAQDMLNFEILGGKRR
jgi:hypothetical protein